MQKRQYIDIRFIDSNTDQMKGRRYTYHYDGPPPQKGQKCKIESDYGWSRARVVAVSNIKPRFATRPIMEFDISNSMALADIKKCAAEQTEAK